MGLKGALKQGIINGHVVPYFQPIVDLRSSDVTGYELLARWNHPIHGMISPGEFIPVAEDGGLMPLLTESLLRHALCSWADLPSYASLSINISPSQLVGNDLDSMINAVAGEAGFPLHRLTLEITESALLETQDEALQVISRLKEAGCKLALDDFGTGYSSLTYLRTLPFDILKVDQSFVRTMATRREDRKIVGAVVGLGKSLGLKVVAEGIEEFSQAEMLRHLGCEYGQGWLYGKPSEMPVFDVAAVPAPSASAHPSSFHSKRIFCMEALPAQSYAQLTAIYNAAPVGLAFLDCNFRFVNLNHRIAGFHCLAIDELVGRTLQEIDPVKFALAEPYLLRARSGETLENVEFELPPSTTGATLTHLASFQPALDEVGEVVGVLLAVTDISERKRVETALTESYAHYSHLLELSPQMPWTMDADGSNFEMSSKWAELTGFTLGRAADRTWLDAVHEEDQLKTTQSIQDSLSAGVALDVEYRLKGKDGLWHWARSYGTPRRDPSGQVIRWYGDVEIIDKQRQLQDALNESYSYFKQLRELQQNRETRTLATLFSEACALVGERVSAFWKQAVLWCPQG